MLCAVGRFGAREGVVQGGLRAGQVHSVDGSFIGLPSGRRGVGRGSAGSADRLRPVAGPAPRSWAASRAAVRGRAMRCGGGCDSYAASDALVWSLSPSGQHDVQEARFWSGLGPPQSSQGLSGGRAAVAPRSIRAANPAPPAVSVSSPSWAPNPPRAPIGAGARLFGTPRPCAGADWGAVGAVRWM